eukprot:m51a1_g830 putative ubiquitin-conjugating enzyme 34 isoform 1 (169) ;mRNA; f:734069-734693
MSNKPTPECVRRLRLEWQAIMRSPIPNLIACPDPDDITLWHYALLGPEDTPYAGGVYYGRVQFKPNYPHAPPAIFMSTPSGRFKPETRLCLSMSDYHPETWTPAWSVSSILLGLLSFMLENTVTAGSIETSVEDKRALAASSLEFNKSLPKFRQLFPSLLDPEDSAPQ